MRKAVADGDCVYRVARRERKIMETVVGERLLR